MRRFLMMMVVFLACPIAAHAELERTNWAWDTRTPEQGNIAANVWIGHETYEYSAREIDAKYTNASLAVFYGIRDNWSAGLSSGYSWVQFDGYGRTTSADDATDIYASTTYRFLDEVQSGFDLALRAGLNIPAADEDRFGSGNWEPKLEMLTAKTFGKVIAVSNVGIRQIIDPDEGEEDFTFDAILECVLPLTERLSISGILSTGTMRWETSANEAYYMVGGGLRFFPTKTTYLSGTVSRYVARDAYNNDWYFVLGMGVEF